jgi:hypothetical protein
MYEVSRSALEGKRIDAYVSTAESSPSVNFFENHFVELPANVTTFEKAESNPFSRRVAERLFERFPDWQRLARGTENHERSRFSRLRSKFVKASLHPDCKRRDRGRFRFCENLTFVLSWTTTGPEVARRRRELVVDQRR